MAARLPALRLLLLLGMWAVPGHGGAAPRPGEPILRLTGGGCRCTGMLEVKWQGWWRRVCQDKASDEGADGICRRLGCGPTIPQPLQLIFTSKKEPPMLRCLWLAATSVECYRDVTNCTEPAIITCSEPVKTTPKPPPAPPATTPEPTGPDRLQLVDGDFGCSGYVELHRQGLWGSVADGPGIRPELATRICQDLRCGTAVDSHGYPKPEWRSHLPVRWEVVEPCESRLLFDCFNRTRAQQEKAPAFIICSRSQPQALRRLAGGPTPCEGDVEVFHEGRWQVLCDNRAQRSNWGRQLCQELRCGNLSSSTELRDPPLHGCHLQNPHPTPLLHQPQGSPDLLPDQGRVPGLEATACWHSGRHHREHLPGPASLRHPLAALRPSCLQEADEENLQKEAAPVDRPHGTQPDCLLPPQQHRHPQATGRGAAGARGGQRLCSAPPEELLPLGIPSPGRRVQSFQPSGQLLRQRLRPAFCPQSV
ncbi:unnamed protein product, partial [Bubo scandiacus]